MLPPSEDELKYLDRLIAVEPTWQNYQRRAERRFRLKRGVDAAQDHLEAGRLAGVSYWHGKNFRFIADNPILVADDSLVYNLLLPATGTLEKYQLGLRLAEKLSAAIPQDRVRRLQLTIAHYRLGNYGQALSLLEPWQHEWERAVVTQLGPFFLMGPRALLLDNGYPHVENDVAQAMAFLAMTHHRLGHGDRARAALADLRRMGEETWFFDGPRKDQDYYKNLLHEAEVLIEGRPQPGK
jgi:hypothetical protein